jgi:hypothetical protein
VLSPPTDTIAKFCAIFGLALCGICLTLGWNLLQTFEAQQIDFAANRQESELATARLKEMNAELTENRAYETPDETIKRLRETMERYREARAVAEAALVKMTRNVAAMESGARLHPIAFGVFGGAIFVGVYISAWGFYLWSKHEQKQRRKS